MTLNCLEIDVASVKDEVKVLNFVNKNDRY